MSEGTTVASTACELFKVARSEWMTREEIAEHSGLNLNSVRRWVDEFTAHGILVQRERPRRGDGGGRGAAEFALAREWGGCGYLSTAKEAAGA